MNEDDADEGAFIRGVLEKIERTDDNDWYTLFEVKRGVSEDDEEAHRNARAVFKRLVRVVHPDRCSQFEWRRVNRAAGRVLSLWDRAAKYFAGGAGPKPDSPFRPTPKPDPPKPDPPRGGSSRSRPNSSQSGEDFGSRPETPRRDEPKAASQTAPPYEKVAGGALELIEKSMKTSPPTILASPTGDQDMYVGFGTLETIKHCHFNAMSTNRCISQDVVAQRVARNLAQLRTTGKYCDFGQISLVAVRTPSSEQYTEEEKGGQRQRLARFYVLDGQHRLSAMAELERERPNVPISFALSIKVVDTKRDANALLLHMQNAYPPDPSCFFQQDREAEVAALTLDCARIQWPNAFPAADVGSFSRARRPVNRPRLDDGHFFDLLRDSRLLAEAIAEAGESTSAVQCSAMLFARVKKVNAALRKVAEHKEKEATFKASKEEHSGCFLGFYRRDDKGSAYLQELIQLNVLPSTAGGPPGSEKTGERERGGGGSGQRKRRRNTEVKEEAQAPVPDRPGLASLSVSQLKSLLDDKGVSHAGCLEKQSFVDLAREHNITPPTDT